MQLHRACPTRSPRTSETHSIEWLVREHGHPRRLRDHRRADRPAHRRPGQGRARAARRGRRAWRRTARRRGWATTRSSRPTTPSGGSRRCRSAARARTSSTGPRSTSRGSTAATRSTRCPTAARWTSTSATCPTRTRARSSRRSARSPTSRSSAASPGRPRSSRARTRTCSRCATRCGRFTGDESLSVGRDGASDAITFLDAGIPAVEFGPVGAGHHGPEEWVSIASLARYRQALAEFVTTLPERLAAPRRRRARAARGRGRPGVSRAAVAPERGMLLRSRSRRCSSSSLTAGRQRDRGAAEDRRHPAADRRAATCIPELRTTPPKPGKPQTLLLLGSDRRWTDERWTTGRARTR